MSVPHQSPEVQFPALAVAPDSQFPAQVHLGKQQCWFNEWVLMQPGLGSWLLAKS